MNLMKNVHHGLETPEEGESFLVSGDYDYWHYKCDEFPDSGWGCGYRTLQTICSWIQNNRCRKITVPSIPEIQEILVSLEDKEKNFVGSKDWIGSFEVCLVLDARYDISSKIVHIPNGKELHNYAEIFKKHFQESRCPVMMGGSEDCSSKGIMGIHFGKKATYLLVVDPHFVGKGKTKRYLQESFFVKWQNINDFVNSSFYNVCLPQIKLN